MVGGVESASRRIFPLPSLSLLASACSSIPSLLFVFFASLLFTSGQNARLEEKLADSGCSLAGAA